MAHVLKCQRLDLYLIKNKFIVDIFLKKFFKYIIRRSYHEPIQYIVGNVSFCRVKLIMKQGILIPRTETEELISILVNIFQKLQKSPTQILDLGTGSGAIALALADYYPKAEVIAVDKSKNALILAKKNAFFNKLEKRVRFICSSWFNNINKRFDLIVSNPPYLTKKEYKATDDEVYRYESKKALVSKNKGIADLEHILNEAPFYLKKGGCLAMETGIKHHKKLIKKIKKLNYKSFDSIKDLFKKNRFFIAWKDYSK